MTTETRPAPIAVAGRAARRHPITVDLYERIVEAGLLKGLPVFLWEGQLVRKMTKGLPHSNALTALYILVSGVVPDGWHVRQEQPIALGEDSLPEPDLAVVRGGPWDYRDRRPTAGDLALIAEVSDSSLAEDRGEVLRSYAAASIPVYWIVNLPHRRFEAYTDPTGPDPTPMYRAARFYGPGDEVTVVLDGREVGRVAVRDILP